MKTIKTYLQMEFNSLTLLTLELKLIYNDVSQLKVTVAPPTLLSLSFLALFVNKNDRTANIYG